MSIKCGLETFKVKSYITFAQSIWLIHSLRRHSLCAIFLCVDLEKRDLPTDTYVCSFSVQKTKE